MKKVIVLMCLLSLSGCVATIDPTTGGKLYSLDPNAVSIIEPIVKGGLTIGAILATIFPGSSIITVGLAAIGSIFATWKRMKPRVTKAQGRAELCHTSTAALVTAIEEYKKIDPKGWEALKKEIKVGPEVENIIRAIRNLPPIE